MNIQLKQLTIAEPCSADWEQMTGTQQKRFCDHCQKSVHDFSQMHSSEVQQLVCESAGSLCARFARDARGEMITLDYAPRRRNKWLWPVAAFVAGVSFMASYMGYEKFRQSPPTVMPQVLGGMVIAPRPITPSNVTQGDVAMSGCE